MPGRPVPIVTALLALAAAGCGPAPAEAFRAYREGRFAEAHRAFEAAARAVGADAPPEIHHDAALAALRAGALSAAEAAADRAAAAGGPRFEALRDFLHGSVAFARCDAAEAEAAAGAGPAVDGPSALDQAVAHAATALEHWSRAAAAREDWPEARRNAERAALRLRRLEARRERERRSRPRVPGAPPPIPVPAAGPGPAPPPVPRVRPGPDTSRPRDEGDPTGAEPPAAGPAAAIPAAELVRVLRDRLAALEREKRRVRGAEREARGAAGEKDW